jgi:hypothetical protein
LGGTKQEEEKRKRGKRRRRGKDEQEKRKILESCANPRKGLPLNSRGIKKR